MTKGISNTSRTLEYIRSQGWEADKVEQFNPYAGKFGKRKDLFGIIDIIALGDKPGAIGIQSCGQSFAEHNKKIMDSPMALKWLEKHNTLILIGWRKIKLRPSAKAMRWSPRIKEYTIEDFTRQPVVQGRQPEGMLNCEICGQLILGKSCNCSHMPSANQHIQQTE